MRHGLSHPRTYFTREFAINFTTRALEDLRRCNEIAYDANARRFVPRNG